MILDRTDYIEKVGTILNSNITEFKLFDKDLAISRENLLLTNLLRRTKNEAYLRE